MLRQTGQVVRLKLARYRYGRQYEQLQHYASKYRYGRQCEQLQHCASKYI